MIIYLSLFTIYTHIILFLFCCRYKRRREARDLSSKSAAERVAILGSSASAKDLEQLGQTEVAKTKSPVIISSGSLEVTYKPTTVVEESDDSTSRKKNKKLKKQKKEKSIRE